MRNVLLYLIYASLGFVFCASNGFEIFPVLSQAPLASEVQASKKDGLAKEIYQRLAKLASLREKRKQLDAQLKEEAVREDNVTVSIRSALDIREERLEQQKTHIRQLTQMQTDLERESKLHADLFLVHRKRVLEELAFLRIFIQTGIPIKLEERLQVLDEIELILKRDEIDEEQIAAVQRFRETVTEVIHWSTQIELLNRPIDLAVDRRIHAWIFRAGALSAVFKSEDEKVFGIWHPKRGWVTQKAPDIQKRIKEVIAIASSRSAPRIQLMPLYQHIAESAKGEGR